MSKSKFHDSAKTLCDKLNNAFRDTMFWFEFPSWYNRDWHRLFIKRDEEGTEISIGRITLKREGDKAKIYYIKSYKPDGYPFDFDQDCIWVMIDHYLSTGKMLTEKQLKKGHAQSIKARKEHIESIQAWRDANPKEPVYSAWKGKQVQTNRRRRIEGKSIRHLFNMFFERGMPKIKGWWNNNTHLVAL